MQNSSDSDGLNKFLIELGGLSRFTVQFFRELFRPPYEHKEFLKQAYQIGLSTLPLISITAFIMGLVLTLQSKPVMAEFGAESWLPGMVSVSIVREIGPVITALICAGKIGSGIGAELGSMRVTEQIDAMDVSGTNPMNYLVVTRVLATTFMIPILVFYADAVSFYGSYLAVNLQGFTSFPLFMSLAFDPLHFYDLIPATIKTFFFGFAIGIIGCYKGYYSEKGTEGVGRAANSAVVISSLVIFIMDLIAVQLADLLNIFMR
ncbi:MAG: ABC transporter permease [Marinilabiliales bacterium]|nr:MAG: ABC transporter permease [Marinilabiliales bacterium]